MAHTRCPSPDPRKTASRARRCEQRARPAHPRSASDLATHRRARPAPLPLLMQHHLRCAAPGRAAGAMPRFLRFAHTLHPPTSCLHCFRKTPTFVSAYSRGPHASKNIIEPAQQARRRGLQVTGAIHYASIGVFRSPPHCAALCRGSRDADPKVYPCLRLRR